MQRINLGSPSKENQLPKQQKGSPKKKIDVFKELTTFLRSSGITLPPNIQKLVTQSSNPESPLKTSNKLPSDLTESDNKKMKIQLEQCKFELKKMEEDNAEYKRNIKLEREKENKKLQEMVSRLKSNLEQNTEDNFFKYEKMKNEFAQQIESIKKKYSAQRTQEIQKISQQFNLQLQGQQKIRKRQVEELKDQFTKKTVDIHSQYQKQISKIKNENSETLKMLGLKHKCSLQQKQKKYDSIYTAIQSEKKTEEKLHQKTRIESHRSKQKLISQLCYEKNLKIQLQEECEIKCKEIRSLKSRINDQQIDLTLKEEKYSKKFKEIEQNYKDSVQKIEVEKANQVCKIMKKHDSELTKYQQKIENLKDLLKKKEQIFEESISDLSSVFQKRPSKKEDVMEIEKLKYYLTKKEEDVKKLNRDLKHTNLQLENKEDIYSRIFKGGSLTRHQKRSIHKDEKEHAIIEQKLGRDIFRKSQTSDIKFLLKVYNNGKNIAYI